MKVTKIDVERHPATADRLGIRGIPTLILFRNGKEIWRLVNVVNKSAISTKLDDAIDAAEALP